MLRPSISHPLLYNWSILKQNGQESHLDTLLSQFDTGNWPTITKLNRTLCYLKSSHTSVLLPSFLIWGVWLSWYLVFQPDLFLVSFGSGRLSGCMAFLLQSLSVNFISCCSSVWCILFRMSKDNAESSNDLRRQGCFLWCEILVRWVFWQSSSYESASCEECVCSWV